MEGVSLHDVGIKFALMQLQKFGLYFHREVKNHGRKSKETQAAAA